MRNAITLGAPDSIPLTDGKFYDYSHSRHHLRNRLSLRPHHVVQHSGGYIIFPDVGQFGIIFGGGTYGRGAVYNVSGEQVGWAALNRASIGLQLGAQSFKMAIIMQDKTTFESFKGGTWQGDVAATAVAARAGAATTAQFDKGVAVYIGDQAGLMAGMSIALSHVAYKNMSDVE